MAGALTPIGAAEVLGSCPVGCTTGTALKGQRVLCCWKSFREPAKQVLSPAYMYVEADPWMSHPLDVLCNPATNMSEEMHYILLSEEEEPSAVAKSLVPVMLPAG